MNLRRGIDGSADIRRVAAVDGEIVFDNTQLQQVGRFESAWFEPEYWRERGLAVNEAAGRGSITYAHGEYGDWVLRHYHRGGLVARVMGDRYLWRSAEATRSFAEFRLLVELAQRDLHVPRPVAARYRRDGSYYRADLITVRIANASTLAQTIARNDIDNATARHVGAAIARLHTAGVYHADLNAHNVLIDSDSVWIIDFDRGEIRAPDRSWQHANLARLKRSLRKLGAARDGEAAFERALWQPLMDAYESAIATTHAAMKTSNSR